MGFELKYFLIYRYVYNVELLDIIKGMKSNILIPVKSYLKIRKMIEEYLKGIGV